MREASPYSVASFRRRVAERFGPERGPAVGEHLLTPELAELFLAQARRQAAVLVPIVHREPEATVLLTLRTSHLRTHAGQIAFPGGAIDPEDAGPQECALREAQEEIGLDPAYVEAVALGPDYVTGSGFLIVPVLAMLTPGFQLSLNPHEVVEAFEVPLGFLMDPANHRKASRPWEGSIRHYFEMPFGNRHIWGITAGILRVIYERLYAEESQAAAGVA